MEAQIIKKTKDYLLIEWSKNSVGFGELTMIWDYKKQDFVLDSECMDVDTVIEIFKAAKPMNTVEDVRTVELFNKLGIKFYTERHHDIVTRFLESGNTEAKELLDQLGDWNKSDLKIVEDYLNQMEDDLQN